MKKKHSGLRLSSESIRILDQTVLTRVGGAIDNTIVTMDYDRCKSDLTQCRLTDKVSMVVGTCGCKIG